MSSNVPEIAFTQKPSHITGKNRSIGASGMRRAKPSIRRSTAVFIPTRKPRPTVCAKRIVGYAQSELDSRTHEPSALFSTLSRNCMFLPPGPRGRGLLRPAAEARRLVGTARSLVDGHLRVRAQRPCALHDAVGQARRHDLVWRLAVFHP